MLQHGADESILDKDGKTAQDIYKINIKPKFAATESMTDPVPLPNAVPVTLVCASANTTRAHGAVCPKCFQMKLSFKIVKNELICSDCS